MTNTAVADAAVADVALEDAALEDAVLALADSALAAATALGAAGKATIAAGTDGTVAAVTSDETQYKEELGSRRVWDEKSFLLHTIDGSISREVCVNLVSK